MSTFKGIVNEFPQIRIDYFRQQPGHRPPLACFLSHVHSDHLLGLESLRAHFVYCSAATREILLRLEKYHYRINFAQGKLEGRTVTYDRSMRRLAKPLPLDTPTTIELAPGNSIQVTLIDANHCIGAVMFLIEGSGKAVLYTGDIRAEQWWVNSLVQNPVLLPYAFGARRLDCMYLDTTFATKSQPFREFQSKADGIAQLLQEVAQYPDDTIFYFHSWTFGYEDVWIALSTFLRSRIHLDQYRTRLYGSLSNLDSKLLREVGLDVRSDNKYLKESGLEVREAPALCGFKSGNRVHPGCLTSQENVRIHSCERGMGCGVVDNDEDRRVVHIIPIITRVKDTNLEIAELGAGGGKGDLDKKDELETGTAHDVDTIMGLCAKSIQDQELLTRTSDSLREALQNGDGTIDLDMDLIDSGQEQEADLSLKNIASILSSHITKKRGTDLQHSRTIRFPYSRHSSFNELCYLVDAFKPKDVVPCTVDEKKWDPELSMRFLFGPFCSGDDFRHDKEMMEIYEARLEQESLERRAQDDSQHETQLSDTANVIESDSSAAQLGSGEPRVHCAEPKGRSPSAPADVTIIQIQTETELQSQDPSTTFIELLPEQDLTLVADSKRRVPGGTSPSRERKQKRLKNSHIAYQAALGLNGLTWADFGGLVSARTQFEEEEL